MNLIKLWLRQTVADTVFLVSCVLDLSLLVQMALSDSQKVFRCFCMTTFLFARTAGVCYRTMLLVDICLNGNQMKNQNLFYLERYL